MRRKQKLPPMLLFTPKAELFDWFGWGDWLYVLASLLSFVQSFFVFTSIGDDANCAFNVIGKIPAIMLKYVYYPLFSYCYSKCGLFSGLLGLLPWLSFIYARASRCFEEWQSKCLTSSSNQVKLLYILFYLLLIH